jgi:hypothetical protein
LVTHHANPKTKLKKNKTIQMEASKKTSIKTTTPLAPPPQDQRNSPVDTICKTDRERTGQGTSKSARTQRKEPTSTEERKVAHPEMVRAPNKISTVVVDRNKHGHPDGHRSSRRNFKNTTEKKFEANEASDTSQHDDTNSINRDRPDLGDAVVDDCLGIANGRTNNSGSPEKNPVKETQKPNEESRQEETKETKD